MEIVFPAIQSWVRKVLPAESAGTQAYAKVTVLIDLVTGSEGIKTSLDGSPSACSITSATDSWAFGFQPRAQHARGGHRPQFNADSFMRDSLKSNDRRNAHHSDNRGHDCLSCEEDTQKLLISSTSSGNIAPFDPDTCGYRFNAFSELLFFTLLPARCLFFFWVYYLPTCSLSLGAAAFARRGRRRMGCCRFLLIATQLHLSCVLSMRSG